MTTGGTDHQGTRRAGASFLVYALLAFAVTWVVWVPRMLATRGVLDADLAVELGAVWSYGPAIAAVGAAWWTGRRAALRELGASVVRWRVGGVWYLAIVALPVSWVALTVLVARTTGAEVELRVPSGGLVGLLVVWLALTLTDGLGEEVGWRGWALPRLLERLRPLDASILLGLVWAAWHLPLLYTVGSYLDGSAAWVLFARLPATAIVFTWVFLRTRHSAFVAILLHGVMNVTAGLVTPSPATDAASVVAHWITAAAVLVLVGRDLGSTRTSEAGTEGEPAAA